MEETKFRWNTELQPKNMFVALIRQYVVCLYSGERLYKKVSTLKKQVPSLHDVNNADTMLFFLQEEATEEEFKMLENCIEKFEDNWTPVSDGIWGYCREHDFEWFSTHDFLNK